MAEHALILRHFDAWLEKKKLTADTALLETLLDLRATYDDLEPTYWPNGSVEDLLLRLWPAKGAAEPPDGDELVTSLEAWFKFLRSTGRMSMRSAEVKQLVKEARRVAPELADVASDPTLWSPGKAMTEFGRSQGIELDGAASIEELQDRLDEIQRRWNALPMLERRRLMPGPDETDVPERERLMQAYGVDDPIVGLLMSFAPELPDGELPPEDVTGPQFARSPYARQLVGFAEWAQPGQPLTDTDNLRLKPAREAYDLLGLESWTRRQVERRYPDESWPGVAAVGRETWIEQEMSRPWRSAADCEALERLWWGGFSAGLLEQVGRKLVGHPPGDLDDEQWLGVGVRACRGILVWLEDRGTRLATIVYALLRSYVTERSRVGYDELGEFSDAWIFEPSLRAKVGRSAARDSLAAAAIGLVADTGLIDVDDEGVRLTEFGDVFVSWWLKVMEER